MSSFESEIKFNNNMIKILDYSRDNYIPTMLSSSARFLFNLVCNAKPENVLEIGTAVGYSAILMLKAGAKNVTTIEVDENRFLMANKNFNDFGYSNQITSILGDANQVLLDLQKYGNKYNLVFVDGPKSKYLSQFLLIDKLVDSGGVVVFDDALYMYSLVKEGFVEHKHRAMINKLREFVKYVQNQQEYDVRFVNVDEGMIIATKK